MPQHANSASAACVIAATVFLVPAVAWSQGAAPLIVNRAPASGGMKYWTADRMAAATPVGVALTGGPAAPAVAPHPTGAPGGGGGTLPGQQRADLPAISDQAWAAATAPAPTDGSYPGPNTTFVYGARFLTYPVSTIGKLFFTEPGVGDFVCSAAVTTGSASINNIIWTAGHCAANGGHATFYTNWLFCPSYNAGGVNPAVGCWNWSYATTSGEWFNSGAFTRDYAIIGLQHSGTVINADVATVTGSLGFGYNFPRDQNWVHMGYPAASPYDGTRIIATNTEHRYDDTPDNLGPPTNSWGSAQTPGSSGSAVMLFFNYSSPPWINSDVSYYYTNPNQYGVELQGPYFDTQVCTFWKNNTGWPNAC